jgi:Tol biopolymer transport system component
MTRRLVSVLICFITLSTAVYAQKRAFTIEDLYRVKPISDVHVSPDGKSVVYVVAESDLPRAKRIGHIWMMDIDGTNVRQLTFAAKGESSPRFSPDGKSLLMVSSRDGAPNIYVIPLNGGEARRVTNVSTGVADPLWSPDSK